MKRTISSGLLCLSLACLFLVVPAIWAKKKKHHPTPTFDYYLLAISWAPNYCAGHPGDHSSECQAGKHVAFVLHGLWPQANSGQPPMACAPASPVATATVDHMLQFMPSRSLIQHEWAKHGTCSGLSAADYFHKVEQAYTSIQVPEQYRTLSQERDFSLEDLEEGFADVNHAPVDAFRVSCHGKDLVGMEICFSKDLRYQACSASARECPVSQVDLRPPL